MPKKDKDEITSTYVRPVTDEPVQTEPPPATTDQKTQERIAELQAELADLQKPPKVEWPKMLYAPHADPTAKYATKIVTQAEYDGAKAEGWLDHPDDVKADEAK